MLLKLATRNIKRSVRDYTVYFVTLLLAVLVFYAFNSITDQSIMQTLASSGNQSIVEFMPVMMRLFTMVVALVLGFLVIYSNQLLVRRRKHEFGLYFTLGMTPGQVSRILLYETVLVGAASLGLGLLLGVLASQLLAFFTAALFGVAVPSYQFEFSPAACAMTLLCFAAIYVVVAVFNVVSVGREKLIHLLNADARSQKVAVRNPWVCLALFALSIGVLALAYGELRENGMNFVGDEHFVAATVLMLVGSLLFFFSLAGFVIGVLTRAKRVYFKGLRPFTARQIASKVNSSFASVWVVCILLFFAVTTFSTGMALVDLFVGDIDEANPYDASICTQSGVEGFATKDGEPWAESQADITQTLARLERDVVGWKDLVSAAAQVDVYRLPGTTYGQIMEAVGEELPNSDDGARSAEPDLVALSQLNAMRELVGLAPVKLGEGEYLVTNNMQVTQGIADAMVADAYPLQTPAGVLLPASEVASFQWYDNSILTNGLTLVVPDAVVNDLMEKGAQPAYAFTNIMFQKNSDAEDVLMERVMATGIPGVTNLLTRQEMISQAGGLRMMITYLALYIGLVLLIATAAVLAVQVLSLTIDSVGRYRLLSQVGCDRRMLQRSLLAQVLVYFLLPLGLAVCHSAWTVSLLSQTLFSAFGSDLLPSILLAGALVLAVYGGYLLVTYLAGRSVLRGAVR